MLIKDIMHNYNDLNLHFHLFGLTDTLRWYKYELCNVSTLEKHVCCNISAKLQKCTWNIKFIAVSIWNEHLMAVKNQQFLFLFIQIVITGQIIDQIKICFAHGHCTILFYDLKTILP